MGVVKANVLKVLSELPQICMNAQMNVNRAEKREREMGDSKEKKEENMSLFTLTSPAFSTGHAMPNPEVMSPPNKEPQRGGEEWRRDSNVPTHRQVTHRAGKETSPTRIRRIPPE